MASWEQALQAIGTGRERAWEEEQFHALFHQHYGTIVAVTARMLGDRGQAEEVADDAFWRLYRKPELADEGNNVPGWLYRTATRLALDVLRGRKRGWLTRERIVVERLVADGDDPLRALERGEDVARVRSALARLRPVQAQMLVLRQEGLSYAELAAALGMKATSVGTTLARAERAFAKAYQEERK